MNEIFINMVDKYLLQSLAIGWFISSFGPLQRLMQKLPVRPWSRILQQITSCCKCSCFWSAAVWMMINGDYNWILPVSALTAIAGAAVDRYINTLEI